MIPQFLPNLITFLKVEHIKKAHSFFKFFFSKNHEKMAKELKKN